MSPRVLIVAPNLLYGDPNPRSIRARRLAGGLAERGFEVELLAWWSGLERAPTWLDGVPLAAVHSPIDFMDPAADAFDRWAEAALGELEGRAVCNWPGVVLAIGVPVGAIVAGARIAARLGAGLIADLGDPWDVAGEREAQERAEALDAAAALITTTPALARELSAFLPEGAETLLAPNGGNIRRRDDPAPDPPLFVHLGAINPGRVDPAPAYAALAAAAAAGRLEFSSHTTGFWPGLDALHPHLPLLPHGKALDLLAHSSAALILGNRNPAQLPSKAFELACTDTWALCVPGSETDPVVELLSGTGHAVVAEANDPAAISAAVLEILERDASGRRPEPAARLSWERRFDDVAELVAHAGG